MTVAEAAELWLSRREAQQLEAGSRRTYGGYVKHIVARIGTVKLSKLTEQMVDALADGLVAELGALRAKRVLCGLTMMLGAARKKKLVAFNAAAEVKIKTARKAPLMVGVDVPTKAEVQAIIAAVKDVSRPRLMTLLFTGMRASELRGLTWEDVNLDRGTVRVRQRADWDGRIGKTKSHAGYREIPLPPIALNTLKVWQLASDPGNTLVFPGQGKTPLNHGTLRTAFELVQRDAGVVDAQGVVKYSLHALRHFYASWHIERGTEPKRLQQLMGHGSIRMTYDTYGHWLGTDEEAERASLARDAAALLA
jgi:integrase